MNQYPEKLRRILLKVDFEFGLDVVNAGEREIIGECAVTRNVQAAAHLPLRFAARAAMNVGRGPPGSRNLFSR